MGTSNPSYEPEPVNLVKNGAPVSDVAVKITDFDPTID